MDEQLLQISRTVLSELDWFQQHFSLERAHGLALRGQLALKDEPFIAYVHVQESLDEVHWEERTYLICRGESPLALDPKGATSTFANRNAPIGRIASLDPDEEVVIMLPRPRRVPKTIRVIEKDVFVPRRRDEWDAINNQIAYGFTNVFVRSLRELVSQMEPTEITPDVGDLLVDELRRSERQEVALHEGSRGRRLRRLREIVESIALKDQPILDSEQDKFCRLPLRSQMILSGSPGTGKTTSLIKRVAMKQDPNHLQETDELMIEDDKLNNWLMFTPNDLLRIYLKEALNKEGLIATDHYVNTWERERKILARDVLRYLKVGDRGYFVVTQQPTLTNVESRAVSELAEDFIEFQDELVVSRFEAAVEDLSGREVEANLVRKEVYPLVENYRNFIAALHNILEFQRPSDNGVTLVSRLKPLAARRKELIDGLEALINEFLDAWIAAKPDRFVDLVEFVSTREPAQIENLDDDDEQDEQDDENPVEPTLGDPRLRTRLIMRQALVAGIRKRQSRNEQTKFIWEFMEINPDEHQDLQVAARLLPGLRNRGLQILDFNALLRAVPRQYQQFRSAAIEAGDSRFVKLTDDPKKSRRINNEEVDILVFVALRLVREIYDRQQNIAGKEMERGVLGRIMEQFRTQIAVDEATDFSAIQLASMYYLTEPAYRSITFSGDLMQRVTTTGLGTWNELQKLLPDTSRYELNTSYRQTPILLSIAKKLYEKILDEPAPFSSKYQGENVFPLPLQYCGARDEILGEWVAERVNEIYQINGGTLPSIAVFVPTEADIDTVHGILAEALNEYSIDVEACRDGKVLGTGHAVRVFSIEYIKGLEFEGVFYIDIDQVVQKDLVDKYLYVGLTRATTFLAVTCSESMPPSLEFLNDDFHIGTWGDFLS